MASAAAEISFSIRQEKAAVLPKILPADPDEFRRLNRFMGEEHFRGDKPCANGHAC
jgi:hypothetical protein